MMISEGFRPFVIRIATLLKPFNITTNVRNKSIQPQSMNARKSLIGTLRLCVCFIILLGCGSLHAQVTVTKADGSVVKRYQFNRDGSPVDTNKLKTIVFKDNATKSKAKTSSQSLLSGPTLCTITGEEYPFAGSYYGYELSCEEYLYNTYYIEVPVCAEDVYSMGNGTSIMVKWSASCVGNTGYFEVYDENYFSVPRYPKTIYIQAAALPLNGGTITTSAYSVCQGANGGTIYASAASEGTCSGVYGYQWQYSYDASTWYNLSGETGQNCNSGTINTATYFRRMTTCVSEMAYTGNILVSVTYAPPAFSISASGSVAICSGTSVQLNGNVDINNYGVSWYRFGTELGVYGNQPSMSTPGLYKARAYNSCFSTYSTNTITVSNIEAPEVASITGGTQFCSSSALQLSNATPGGSWSSSNTGVAVVNSSGYVTANSYGPVTIYYSVTNGCGQTTTQSLAVNVLRSPVTPSVGFSTGTNLLCNGASATLIAYGSDIVWSTGASGNGLTVSSAGTYYARESNSCGVSPASNSISITTANSPSQPYVGGDGTLLCNGATTTLSATETGSITWYNSGGTYLGSGASIGNRGGGSYYAIATNSCGTTQSNTVSLYTGNSPSTPAVGSSSSLLCNGATATLSASETGTIYWYTSGGTYLGIGANISGIGGGSYYALAYNSCGYTQSATITIATGNSPEAPTVSAGSSLLCNGATTTLSATPTGSISWYNSSGTYLGAGNNIGSIGGGSYYAIASNSCGTTQSLNISVATGNSPVAPTLSAGSSLLCNGATTTLSATPTGSITWYTSAGAYLGAGTSIGNIGGGSYYAIAANSCGTTQSANITLTTGNSPGTPTLSAGSSLLCNGATTTLSATPTGSITWYTSSGTYLGAGADIGSIGGGSYYAIATNSCGTTQSLNIAIATGNTPNTPSVSADKYLLCDGATATLTAVGVGTISWYTSANIYLASGLSIPNRGVGTYYAKAENACGYSLSGLITLTAGNTPQVPVVTAAATSFCADTTTSLTASQTGSINWYTAAGANIGSGAVISGIGAGNYYARASNDCGYRQSETIVLTAISLPVAPVITAHSGTVCDSAVFESSVAENYQWYKDGSAINGATGRYFTATGSGGYSAKVSNSSGCISSFSNLSNIVIQATPVQPQISPLTGVVFCDSGQLTTNADNGSIQWYRDESPITGATTQSYTATQTGMYTVKVTISGACQPLPSLRHQVSVNKRPDSAAITGNSTATVGSVVVLGNTIGGGVWSSSQPSVAIVHPQTGFVQARQKGQTIIRYVVSASANCQSSSSFDLAVLEPAGLQGGIISVSPAVIETTGSASLLSVQAASGGTAPIQYTWERSTDQVNWHTTSSPSLTGIQQTEFYRRKAVSGNLYVYSNTARVRVVNGSASGLPVTANGPVNGSTLEVSIPATGAVTEENRNYIRTRNILKNGVLDTTVAGALTTASDVQESTMYYDGLGRPQEQVLRQYTPLQKDFINIHVYDDFGRESRQYLGYSDGAATGTFRTDASVQQPGFYATRFSGTEGFFYGQTVFEASPLQRALKTTAAGKSFTGSDRGVTQISRTNATYDSVRLWHMGTNGYPEQEGMYLPGSLSISATMDEHQNTVLTYTDREAHVVLKKVQVSDTLQPGHRGWLCTYYVYDDFGQLLHVISPKAVEYAMSNSWTLTQGVSDELCFNYVYDARHRMTAKKVPGAGTVYMIYDKRDRLVFTQDANMRAKTQWLYTLYDGLNRPVETGVMTGYGGTAANLQTAVDGLTGSGASGSSISTSCPQAAFIANLVVDARITGIAEYRASNSIIFTDGFISEDSAGFDADIVSAVNGGCITETVAIVDNPIPSAATRTALTITRYDDYSYTQKTFSNNFAAKLDAGNNSYTDAAATTATKATRGMVTSSKVRILENPDDIAAGKWLETASFYDEKGRPVQVQAENYKSGIDITSTRYDFTGKPVSVYQWHTNPAVSTLAMKIKTNMDYDHAGRLLAIRKTLNDNSSTTRNIALNSYDELGQLANKKLGQKRESDGSLSSDPLENQDYAYNIRGWLKGINWNYSGTGTQPAVYNANNKWFGFDLSYDWGFGLNQYNGNISGQRWKTAGDGAERSFGYGYDNVNRILYADFNQKSTSGWAKNDGGSVNIDFSVKMGDGINHASAYDANGNILRMQQAGLKLNSSAVIDALTYAYAANSNKLLAVTDTAGADSKLGDFTDKHTGSNDYGYDLNGNMITDLNKRLNGSVGIDQANGGAIEYNHLNLPWKITVKKDNDSVKGTIKYIYDATGNKLEKRIIEQLSSEKTTTTDYIGGAVYQNDTLQFLGHEEGRIRKTDSGYVYDYFLKDHLGNTRMVLTDEWTVNSYPAATMETAAADVENALYTKIEETRTAKPTAYPTDTYTNPNDWVAKLSGSGNKIGPGIVLKVMSGDKVNIRASSWYKLNGASPGTPVNPATDLLTALATGISGIASTGGKFSLAQLQQPGLLTPGIGDMLTRQTNDYASNSAKPKAYLNWLLFDDQFKLVDSSSGFEQVGADNELRTWVKTGLPMKKNGYLYVYTSNESPVDVFFDNLQVAHIRGPLAEETHYYPFGLTMAGISSKAAGKLENKKWKFQNQELDDDLGLNWYGFKWRNHDPQIGRFIQIDPLSDKYEYNSTYAFSENKVTAHVELEGLEAWSILPTLKNSSGLQNMSTGSFLNRLGSELKKPDPYINAVGVTAQVGAGVLAGIMTEGILSGTVMTAEVSGARGMMSTSEIKPTAVAESGVEGGAAGATPKSAPNYLVDGKGTAYPVPEGSVGPSPVESGKGVQFTGGRGGANGQVTDMRIMDATPAKGKVPGYPEGYIKYTNAQGQGVNPYTGQTGSKPATHFPINGSTTPAVSDATRVKPPVILPPKP
jgi:RHS repeat-associated protein